MPTLLQLIDNTIARVKEACLPGNFHPLIVEGATDQNFYSGFLEATNASFRVVDIVSAFLNYGKLTREDTRAAIYSLGGKNRGAIVELCENDPDLFGIVDRDFHTSDGGVPKDLANRVFVTDACDLETTRIWSCPSSLALSFSGVAPIFFSSKEYEKDLLSSVKNAILHFVIDDFRHQFPSNPGTVGERNKKRIKDALMVEFSRIPPDNINSLCFPLSAKGFSTSFSIKMFISSCFSSSETDLVNWSIDAIARFANQSRYQKAFGILGTHSHFFFSDAKTTEQFQEELDVWKTMKGHDFFVFLFAESKVLRDEVCKTDIARGKLSYQETAPSGEKPTLHPAKDGTYYLYGILETIYSKQLQGENVDSATRAAIITSFREKTKIGNGLSSIHPAQPVTVKVNVAAVPESW